jgi:hypothetical protein
MCYHRSCVVTEDEQIYFHPQSDHHTAIRKEYGLPEVQFHEKMKQVALECVPVTSLFDIGGWKLKIDQPIKPEWFDEAVSKKVMDKLASEHKKFANKNAQSYGGLDELAFADLETYPEGTVFTAQDAIILSGFKRPIKNCVFVSRNFVWRQDPMQRWAEPPMLGCTIVTDRLHGDADIKWLSRCNDVVLRDDRMRRSPYNNQVNPFSMQAAMSPHQFAQLCGTHPSYIQP